MKIRYQYLVYVFLLHLALLFFAWDYFKEQSLWFILVEVIVIAGLYLGFTIYQKLIKPYELISSGAKSIKDKDFSIKFLETKNKELNDLVLVFNKMIDNLREERRITEEKNYFLEKLIQSSPVGIILLDNKENIRSINPVIEQIFSVNQDEIINKPLNILNPKLAENIEDIELGESKVISVSGYNSFRITKSSFLDKGYHHYFIIVEELTTELLKAEKNAYGKVIRMMSHEVNNSVGAINSLIASLSDLYEDVENKDEIIKFHSVITERNNSMNRFMSNFAEVIRMGEPKKEMCETNKFLERIVELMKPSCDELGINIEMEKSIDEFYVELDKDQIEQVIINALRNAMDSIEKEGQIKIVVDQIAKQVQIIDNGKGMTEEQKKNLFKPFYSNKKNGQGIGLTLSKEIAHNHGFQINLENNIDKGARFVLRF